MTAEELREIIACGETSKVQFKLMFSTPKQVAEEMVAFANSKGGMIVFGVEDRTGRIVGLSYAEIQKLSNEVSTAANDQVRPVIYLETEVVLVEGKRLLIAYIHEGSNKPYKTLGGNIWVKQGSDKRRIVENNEILSLFQASGVTMPTRRSLLEPAWPTLKWPISTTISKGYMASRKSRLGCLSISC